MKLSTIYSRSLALALLTLAAVSPFVSVTSAFAGPNDEDSVGILDRDIIEEQSRSVDSIRGDRVSFQDQQRTAAKLKKSLEGSQDDIREQRKFNKALKNVGNYEDDFRPGGRASDKKLTRHVTRHASEIRKVKVVNRAEEEKAEAKAAKKAAKKKKAEQRKAASLARKNSY